MAVSPFMVFYSRSIWGQNLLAPFAIFWAMAALLGLRDIAIPTRWQLRPRWHGWRPELALLLHTFLAGFILQIHPAGVGLTLASLWLGFRFRLWHRWLPIVGGIVLGTLTAVPALYTIAANGAGAQAELNELLSSPAQLSGIGFRQLGQLATADGWEPFWLNQSWVWQEPLATLLQLSSLLLALLAVGGLALLLWQLVADVRQKAVPSSTAVLTALVPVWAIASPLFFVRSSTPVYIQYQLVSAPALFLAMGTAVGWLIQQKPNRQWVILPVLLLISLSQTAAITITLNSISDTLIDGGMGTPLRYPQQLTDSLKATGQPIILHANGAIPEYDGDAAMFRVLLWGYPHQLVDGRYNLLLPATGGILLFPAENVPGWGVWQGVMGDGVDTAVYPRRLGDLPFLTATLPPLTADTWGNNAQFTLLPEPQPLANGATLHGWRTETLPDGQLRLLTLWQIDRAPQAGQFNQFNHLYLPDSPTPDQVQDRPLSSGAWQQGDWLLSWADFAPSADNTPPDRFEVGMYLWPELTRSPLLSEVAAGQDSIPLYPTSVTIQEP
jgi:hypothetical protein